jgi:hypothetical protein
MSEKRFEFRKDSILSGTKKAASHRSINSNLDLLKSRVKASQAKLRYI